MSINRRGVHLEMTLAIIFPFFMIVVKAHIHLVRLDLVFQ